MMVYSNSSRDTRPNSEFGKVFEKELERPKRVIFPLPRIKIGSSKGISLTSAGGKRLTSRSMLEVAEVVGVRVVTGWADNRAEDGITALSPLGSIVADVPGFESAKFTKPALEEEERDESDRSNLYRFIRLVEGPASPDWSSFTLLLDFLLLVLGCFESGNSSTISSIKSNDA